MNEDEVYNQLPDDDGLAFVMLEQFYKQQYDHATSESDSGSDFTFHQMTYLNKVIAAAKHLQIPGIQDYELPESESNIWDFSRLVTRDIQSMTVQVRIANAKEMRRYSVALSNVEKEKARHFIDQLDNLVDSSNCSIDKKEAIKNKLAELRREIELERTRFDRVADKVRALARLSGDVEREGAEPWWKWVKALFGVIDDAKESEEKLSLPRQTETKRLEPPRKQLPKQNFGRDLDDEVPF